METTVTLSPNRGGAFDVIKPWIMLHHTGGSYAGAVAHCLNPYPHEPWRRVSYHLIIANDGRMTQLVPYNQRAWHAGQGILPDGHQDPNGRCIGVSFEGNTAKAPLTEAQLQAVTTWFAKHAGPLGLSADRVTDHRTTRERYLLRYPERDARLGGKVSAKVDLAPDELDRVTTLLQWEPHES